MTCAAGLALLHVGHGGFADAGTIGENLCVAVCTLIALQMEFVAEGDRAGRFREHKVDHARFHALMALGAVAG